MLTISQPFTITITVTPALATLMLSSTTVAAGAENAGMVVGDVIAITNSPDGDTSDIMLSLGGADAAKFVLTSPKLPAQLKIGPVNLPAGTAQIIINADTP